MRKTLRRHRGDPHGARRRWGIENQDHAPSRETITEEGGLRETGTSRLSERTEEGRQPDLLRLYVCLAAGASGGLKSHSVRGPGPISEGGGNASPARVDGRYGEASEARRRKPGHG